MQAQVPSQHGNYTSHKTSLTHWGRGQKQELQPYSLVKRGLKYSKVDKNEMSEGYRADKGEVKTTEPNT